MSEIYNFILWTRVYLTTGTFPQASYKYSAFDSVTGYTLLKNDDFLKFMSYLGMSSGISQYRKRLGSFFFYTSNIGEAELEVISSEPLFDFGGVIIEFDTICDLSWTIVNIDYVMQNPIFNEILTSYFDNENEINLLRQQKEAKIYTEFVSNPHERLIFIFSIINLSKLEFNEIIEKIGDIDVDSIFKLEKKVIEKFSNDGLLTLFIGILKDLRNRTN